MEEKQETDSGVSKYRELYVWASNQVTIASKYQIKGAADQAWRAIFPITIASARVQQ
jgi:hypothetical protein